jgi:hypothetical protein
MKPVWSKPYCNMSYITNVPRRWAISLRCMNGNNALVIVVDRHKNNEAHMSNYSDYAEEFYGTILEATEVAEKWFNKLTER